MSGFLNVNFSFWNMNRRYINLTFEQSLQQRIKRIKKKGVTFTHTQIEDIRLKLQAGYCSVCHKPKTSSQLCIDHNHRKKSYRGVLCHRCNYILGAVHDNQELLANLAEYLKLYLE